MIANHADDLPVIGDSEAFSYLDQNVKVPGLVFAVLISRLRTPFIYPESLMLVARKTIRLLVAALSLILTANHSQADLGWTLAQFKQQYGNPVLDQEQIAGRIGYVFKREDYIIAAFFRNSQVSRILYICRGNSVFDWGRVRALLAANAPDAIWDEASKKEADNFYRVNGTKDGVESYYASLSGDGQMLAIWTKEDDEAGRTTPRLDPPSVSSVAGPNEKTAGEMTAGHVSSIDSELPPEKDYPDPPAEATASPPAERPASAHASRPKIAMAQPRSSISHRENFHVAHMDVKDAKVRSTAFSLRLVRGHSPLAKGHSPGPIPSPTPLLMNAGTGLYNSDNTQPFKSSKKASGP
jgi:hypothetical protein